MTTSGSLDNPKYSKIVTGTITDLQKWYGTIYNFGSPVNLEKDKEAINLTEILEELTNQKLSEQKRLIEIQKSKDEKELGIK